MCAIDVFVDKLYSYLLNKKDSFRVGALIKRHNDKFEQVGEFSFPWKISAWTKHVSDSSADLTIFNIAERTQDKIILEDACKNLVNASKDWPIFIRECKILGERIYVFIDRFTCIKCCLTNFNFELSHSNKCDTNVRFLVNNDDDNDITQYRIKLIQSVAKNLGLLKNYSVLSGDDGKDAINVNFTSKSHNKNSNGVNFVCAPVHNMNGSKENTITIEQYIEKRTLDMKLKAQHKYRVYVTDEKLWNESLSVLGEASAKFDLLQNKPSHPVLINMLDEGSGCSKGASFVLYNYARLSSILNTFKENVSKGVYSELPDVKDIDFSLLNDEDEWILMFNYIFIYNSMLEKCIHIERTKCIISPHHLCSFLSSFVVRFSMYYRKVRVLLKPRTHLVPKIYARIHLLMIIQKIIQHGLSVLNIQLLSEM